MDVLSSQANLAGYKAVLDAAAEFGRAFPMMMTAAGTIKAARVLVMGAGVAGLQAIATARRLGAIVSASDVRAAARSGGATESGRPLQQSAPSAIKPGPGNRINLSGMRKVIAERLVAGEDFWSVVHQPFKAHDLTRSDLRAIIFRGLQHTRGNYRQLVRTFHMPDSDYKRFLSFLSQHDCNLPFQAHRTGEAMASAERSAYEVAC
jgi:hypothetical protein